MKKTFAPVMVVLVAVIFISYVPAVAAKPMAIGLPAHASKLREGDEHAFPSSASKAPRPAEAPPTRRNDLPFAAQAAIAGVLGRDDTAFAVVSTPNGYRAENSGHDLTAEFTAAGVKLHHGDADWSLQLLSVGAGDAENPVAPAEPRASANRVEYGRDELTEWYTNGPLGLEQGFALERAPEGERQGGLTLKLAMAGNLHACVAEGGTAVELDREDGSTALRYAGLSAQDAKGQSLPAWMEIVPGAQANEDEALLLHVDDHRAVYPLLIDPFFQKAELTSSDGALNDAFGSSVATNVDGTIIVVGARHHNIGSKIHQGEAYVFVKPDGGWAGDLTETARLTASDGAASDNLGWSVGISDFGDAIVVGAPHQSDVGSDGKAYVFVKTCAIPPICSWESTNEIAELTASGGWGYDKFGYSVGINGNKSTIVVGGTPRRES